jgi:hypothetical protein
MSIPSPSVRLSAVCVTAALVVVPFLGHQPADGSRVCVGGLETVVCVPPDQVPPSPPSEPSPPPLPPA